MIFEYISDAEEFYNKYSNLFKNSNLYISDVQKEKEFLNKQIEPNTVIISTNLAGRGTDIKISPILENNGGLHVILTFMPTNLRIEEQAFGRAARKGEKGSGQIIMLSNESYENNLKLQKIEEEDNFNYLMYYYKEKNILFHQYFKDFCYYLKILNEKVKIKAYFQI